MSEVKVWAGSRSLRRLWGGSCLLPPAPGDSGVLGLLLHPSSPCLCPHMASPCVCVLPLSFSYKDTSHCIWGPS